MNAAFLLVTSAWLAGAEQPPPPVAKPAPPPAAAPAPVMSAPVMSAPISSTGSCCGGCNTCDSCCEGPSWFERMKARFHRSHDCCDSCSTCAPAHTTHQSCGCEAACDSCGGSWFSRMKGWFKRGECETCDTCSTCGGGHYAAPATTVAPGAMMPPAGEPLKMPKEGPPAKPMPKEVNKDGKEVRLTPSAPEPIPATSKTAETETKNPFELDRRYEARVERAADYSWVTGQLCFVHTDGGVWVLRYAPLGKEDPNGGSVILARGRPMDSYREGDLVTVHGEIVNEKGSLFLGGPLYRMHSIQLIDRPQQ